MRRSRTNINWIGMYIYTSKLTGPTGKVGDAAEVKQPMQVCDLKAGIMFTEYKYKRPFLYVHDDSGNCRILNKVINHS